MNNVIDFLQYLKDRKTQKEDVMLEVHSENGFYFRAYIPKDLAESYVKLIREENGE